ncbi:MAG: hypothetical protein AAGF31_06545 [Planctomycetota bacterium]
MNLRLLTASLVVALSANIAFADEEEEHADILVGRPTTGTQTLIGGANVPDDLNLDERLFEGELGTRTSGSPTNNVFFALEPGFFNAGVPDPMTGLGREDAVNPAGVEPLIEDDEISVAQVGQLLFWDGARPIAFGSTPADLAIFPLDNQADVNGSIDDHPLFEIDLPGSDSLPAGGVYLATLTAQITGPNGTLGISDEFQILFAPEAFEEELEIAEAFLTGEIPEPASLTLVATLAVFAVRRRSRIA